MQVLSEQMFDLFTDVGWLLTDSVLRNSHQDYNLLISPIDLELYNEIKLLRKYLYKLIIFYVKVESYIL